MKHKKAHRPVVRRRTFDEQREDKMLDCYMKIVSNPLVKDIAPEYDGLATHLFDLYFPIGDSGKSLPIWEFSNDYVVPKVGREELKFLQISVQDDDTPIWKESPRIRRFLYDALSTLETMAIDRDCFDRLPTDEKLAPLWLIAAISLWPLSVVCGLMLPPGKSFPKTTEPPKPKRSFWSRIWPFSSRTKNKNETHA